MNSLSKVLEGILDTDFDVKDEDILSGYKKWPKFVDKLKSVGKWSRSRDNDYGISYSWDNYDASIALYEGMKSCIGKANTWLEVRDAFDDPDKAILMYIIERKGNFNECARFMYMGTSDETISVIVNPIPDGDYNKYVTTARISNQNSKSTFESNGFRGKKYYIVPKIMYNAIKRELHLP